MSTPVIIREQPTDESDLATAPRLLGIVKQGFAGRLRVRDVEVLARLVERYAPITMPVEPELPRALTTPSCPGCGFIVETRGEFCESCKAKGAARARPLFDLGPHPTPAYQRESEAPSEASDAIPER